SAFGLSAGAINIFLNEPISGQGNVAEATLFRRPTVYTGSGAGAVLGLSQEANVAVGGVVSNPLAGQAGTCLAGGGARYRAIGSSEEIKAVLNSSAKFGGRDGIGYGIFSFENLTTLANNTAYGYIQVEGVDPIFASYAGGDPGEPGNGTVPGAQNLPAACSGAFPCPEEDIWTGKLSFPNLRNGTYSSWSVLRLISNGTALTSAEQLEVKSAAVVVSSVPDYVPAKRTVVSGYPTDPGLLYLHSHYQQYDGAGTLIGAVPVNSGTKETGGELGGCILKSTSKVTQSVSDSPSKCVTRP